ncbi:MAG: vanadium-dependent haloperoxidase [Planctomycetes bacterium]|nr:vanadium-dependent haloperoxidase [Planctomycetota bacterium]
MSAFTRFAGTAALSLLGFAAAASADVVTDWNGAALQAIRAGNTPPPAASRNLAILHCSVYDAVNGIERLHAPYLVNQRGPRRASREAAASSAARDVLAALYPAQLASFDALNGTILGGIPAGSAKDEGVAWGQEVAAAMLAARANDGSSPQPAYPGSTDPGKWRPTVSFGGVVRPALLPGWGNVAPFGVRSGSQFRPPAPPRLRSFNYVLDWLEVEALGEANSSARTADQTEIARFWGYGPGTATPPGHWNQIALNVSDDQGLSLSENARLFALINIAMADAAIVSWDCKYVYGLWRPITAVQLADTDGNPFTAADPNWTPLLATPPFPEYTSGHSTFSAAAAGVLRRFFGTDRIAFRVGSDDLPGVERSYDSFSHAAFESGKSRIYGGIHFQSANFWGLHTGRLVSLYVMNRLLR